MGGTAISVDCGQMAVGIMHGLEDLLVYAEMLVEEMRGNIQSYAEVSDDTRAREFLQEAKMVYIELSRALEVAKSWEQFE